MSNHPSVNYGITQIGNLVLRLFVVFVFVLSSLLLNAMSVYADSIGDSNIHNGFETLSTGMNDAMDELSWDNPEVIDPYKNDRIDISLIPECVIEEEEGGYLSVEEGVTCKLLPGIYEIPYVRVEGTLYFQTNNTYDSGSGDYASEFPIIISDNIIVTETGIITANGLGFASGDGPGAPLDGNDLSTPGGGGYVGFGGNGILGGGAPYYYEIFDDDLYSGSGGGGPDGGAGGGVINLITEGSLTIDGIVSVNGENGSNYAGNNYSGGGAGGSIYINANSFYGSGIITANGGDSAEDCSSNNCGGGGSGGVVHIRNIGTRNFYGEVEAYGGKSRTNNLYGSAGVYIQQDNDYSSGYVTLDNDGYDARNAYLTPEYVNQMISVRLYGGSNLYISRKNRDGQDAQCVIGGNIKGDKTGAVTAMCDFYSPFSNSFSIAGHTLKIFGNTSNIDAITITDGTVEVHSNPAETPQIVGSITVNDGSELIIVPDQLDDSITLSANTITIDEGAIIRTYDGEGVVSVNTSAGLTVNGELSADGKSGQTGGDLYLTTGTLSGNGEIHANGSDGMDYRQGGNIVIDTTDNQFSGSVEAFGGEYSIFTGNPGFITYVQENRTVINNGSNGGEFEYPEDIYVINRWELGNGIEIVFSGMFSEVTILDGLYSYEGLVYPNTPTVTIEGTITNPEEFTVDGVILNWEGEHNLIVDGTIVSLYSPSDGSALEYEKVIVRNGGTLYLSPTSYNNDITISAEEVLVEANSKIQATSVNGRIILNASDNMVINGSVISDGVEDSEQNGGEIELNAVILSGTGTIQATGAHGKFEIGEYYVPAGDGGSIHYDIFSNQFEGQMKVLGGDYAQYSDGVLVAVNNYGNPGYIISMSDMILYVPNDKRAGGELVFPEGNYLFSEIIMDENVDVIFEGDDTEITVLNSIQAMTIPLSEPHPDLFTDGIVHANGDLSILFANFHGQLDNVTNLEMWSEKSEFYPYDDASPYKFNDFDLHGDLWLYPYIVENDIYTDEKPFTLIVNSLTLNGSRIMADGLGYRLKDDHSGDGPGGGWGSDDVDTYGIDACFGGAYGGTGGYNTKFGIEPAQPNGSRKRPVNLGSSGGGYKEVAGPVGGGGAIKIIALEGVYFNNNSYISANGGNCIDIGCKGGSSGGSIWITAPEILGKGEISATGGYGLAYCGDGSGGRIAIHSPQLSSGIDLDVSVWRPSVGSYSTVPEGWVAPEEGTIYIDGQNPLTDLMGITNQSCGVTKGNYGSADSDDCVILPAICTLQGISGDPINTHTGAFSFSMVDLSFQTAKGELVFQRNYSSDAVDRYTTTLGYGWTHNHDLKLIFPDDEGGYADFILYKGVKGNEFFFGIEDDGTFTAMPGITATLSKQDIGGIITYHLDTSVQTHFIFNEAGRILQRVDENGKVFVYEYDVLERLIKVQANDGVRYISLTYDDENRITSVTDHTERSVEFVYDENGDLASTKDVLDQSWTYTYDEYHYLTEIDDPRGLNSAVTAYDNEGRATQQWDADGNTLVILQYNEDGSTTVIDADGNAITHYYNDNNLLTEEIDPLGNNIVTERNADFLPEQITDQLGNQTQLEWEDETLNLTKITNALDEELTMAYDENNNVTSLTDAKGNESSYTYDGMLLTSSTDVYGNTTDFTYDADGNLETVTDAHNHTSAYDYNEFGQLVSETNSLGYSSTYDYDDLGRLIQSTDASGVITFNEYNAAGWLTTTIRNYDPARSQNEENIYNITTSYTYDSLGNMLTMTDTYGAINEYQYDNNNRLIKLIDAAGGEINYEYNDLGLKTAETDQLGRRISYTHDTLGRVIAITDALGNTSHTSYNSDGTVASITNALGQTTTYTYDALQRVIVITDNTGNTIETIYDEVGNTIETIDAMGRSTNFEYDELNRMIRQTDPMGNVIEKEYDEVGNLVSSKDSRGGTTTYLYDDLNRMISVTDALGNTTTYTYDALGRKSMVTDAKGHTTSFDYDIFGRMVTVTDYLGNTTTSTYDALGRMLTSEDAMGHTYTSAYDITGRLVSQIDPLGGQTQFTYDAVGNQLTTTDPNGHTTSKVYDALNRVVNIVDANNHSQSTSYNAIGNITSVQDAANNETNFVYDNLNRQTSTIDANDNATHFTYNVAGNLLSSIDENGIVTRYEYDELNRLTSILENFKSGTAATSDTNVRTRYIYDENGNRTEIIDGNGNITSMEYDALNRIISETDALGHSTQYLYDELGNLSSMIDANGSVIHYQYDELNRLVLIDYPDPDADVSFTYNAIGQQVTMADGLGTTTWDYDALGRPVSVTDPFGAVVGYDYDAVGNRTGMTYPDGKSVTYAYDPADMLLSVVDWNDQETSYSYNSVNRIVGSVLPNGFTSSYSYDPIGNLLSLTHEYDDLVYSAYEYSYDGVGNITHASEMLRAPGAQSPDVKILVKDADGIGQEGVTVYAFDGETYANYSGVTDENGQASLVLPFGDYRFRADFNGTQFWSGEENHCTVEGCHYAEITVMQPVLLTVQDYVGELKVGLNVYAFDGTTYSGYNAVTDENGQAEFTLPEGEYRFRADFNGTQFWSADEENITPEGDTCILPGCIEASVTVSLPITVTVTDTDENLMEGVKVYVFSDTTYQNFTATTDENGEVEFTLLEGEYRFRADFNGTQFWSDTINHCTIPGCSGLSVVVTKPVTVTVLDTNGAPQNGLKVYAFDGTTYKNYTKTTDENGEAIFTLPEGDYRFRADLNGTQFWSSIVNDCSLPGCDASSVAVTIPVQLLVQNDPGGPVVDAAVYAFDGTSYSGFSKHTNDEGIALFTLPEGDYRFRVDFGGEQTWSDEVNHCTIPGCELVSVLLEAESTPTQTVTTTATDTPTPTMTGTPTPTTTRTRTPTITNTTTNTPTSTRTQTRTFTPTRTFTQSVGNTATATRTLTTTCTMTPTLANTQIPTQTMTPTDYVVPTITNTATLFGGGYEPDFGFSRVLAKLRIAPLADDDTVVIQVYDTDGTPKAGLNVYAFNGTSYSGVSAVSNEYGTVTFTLPEGDYRFRADLNGTQFWSGTENTCSLPGCTTDVVTVSKPVSVYVVDTDGTPKAGLNVYAFNATTYSGYSKVSDDYGMATFTLPLGDYRFRGDLNGTRFWSGEENHCTLPGCESAQVTVSKPVSVYVVDTDGTPKAGLNVYAFDGTTYSGYSKVSDDYGVATFTLPLGEYRFRGDLNGTRFWSAENNHCSLPDCETAQVMVSKPVTVTVVDNGGTPKADIAVYAFDDTTYSGYSKTTVSDGTAVFTLPLGEYRFRADSNGTRFWSAEVNHCTLPGCENAQVTITGPLSITVVDTNGTPQEGLAVYAFDGDTYSNFSGSTDENGVVEMTLPEGDYRFRADLNGTKFWSGTENHCTLPGCSGAIVTVTKPLTVTVLDTNETPQEGLNVYAFNETTYANYSMVTNEEGTAVFTLPEGDYRFRADLNGTQFWSAESNHCTLPGCEAVDISVTMPVTVHVVGVDDSPFEGINVYAFNGATYANYSGISNEDGEVLFTLPEGDYRFRADLGGTQFWSGEANTCIVPGCTSDEVILPGGESQIIEHEIDYTYDGLYRLTTADYEDEDIFFHYTYDAVGNRLTQETADGSNSYTYDAANLMTGVDGTAYTWDANGNMLSDGSNSYTYNHANQLTTVSGMDLTSYVYNGLGNRYQQIINGNTTTYQLDLVSGLVQVLNDGENNYLYGNTVIEQISETQTGYYLPDVLGSVRQMIGNNNGEIGEDQENAALLMAQSFTPYGEEMENTGESQATFGYTGQKYDTQTGLLYLRARYYAPETGRFITKDTWKGDYLQPTSLNRWNYVYANPINLSDPSGNKPEDVCQLMSSRGMYEKCIDIMYGISPVDKNNMGKYVKGKKGCYEGPSIYRARGYYEGMSLSASIAFVDFFVAQESAYNFATMEHSNFISGYDSSVFIKDRMVGPGLGFSDTGYGISFTEYYGTVIGFTSPDEKGNSHFVREYGGLSYTGTIGPSLDFVAGVSAGATFFRSLTDKNIFGIGCYQTLSVSTDPPTSPPVDLSVGVINLLPNGVVNTYVKEGNKVDVERMKHDIMNGTYRAWLFNYTLPLSERREGRLKAVADAAHFAMVYENLH